jgi:hypothetical protein
VAAALLGRPQVLVHDEPSNGPEIVECFLVGTRKRSTIMVPGPIYADFKWCVVGLWSVCRVGARSRLHDKTTLQFPPQRGGRRC